MSVTAKWWRRAFLAAAMAVLAAGPAMTAEKDKAQRPDRPRRPGGPVLKVGQRAPDFELPPLTFRENDEGDTVGRIGQGKVKLSAFRGKAPVCIFSSSYT
jgi:hypothetical protein